MRDGDRQANVACCGAVRFRHADWTTNSATLWGYAHAGSNPARLSNRNDESLNGLPV